MYRLVTIALGGVLLAALALSVLGPVQQDPVAVAVSAAVAVGVSVLAGRACGALWRTRVHTESAVITGLILALLFWPETTPAGLGVVALAAALAALSKFVVAVRARHVLNPAAAGALAAGLLAPLFGGFGATWWVATPALLPVVAVAALAVVAAHPSVRARGHLPRRRARRAPASARRRRSRAARRPPDGPAVVPARLRGRVHAHRAAHPAAAPVAAAVRGCPGRRADGRTVQPRRPVRLTRARARRRQRPGLHRGSAPRRPPAGARPADGHAGHPRGRVRVRRRGAVPARAVDRAPRPAHRAPTRAGRAACSRWPPRPTTPTGSPSRSG